MCVFVCVCVSKDRVFGADVYHVWVVCLIFQYNFNKSLGEDVVSVQGIFLHWKYDL